MSTISEGNFVLRLIKPHYSEGVYDEWWEVYITISRWSFWRDRWCDKTVRVRSAVTYKDYKFHTLSMAQFKVMELIDKYKSTKKRIVSIDIRHVVIDEHWVRGEGVRRIDAK